MAPLPKRKHSTARKGRRLQARKVELEALILCKNCNQPKRSHQICKNCNS